MKIIINYILGLFISIQGNQSGKKLNFPQKMAYLMTNFSKANKIHVLYNDTYIYIISRQIIISL